MFSGVRMVFWAPILFFTTLPHARKFSTHNKIGFRSGTAFRGGIRWTCFGKNTSRQQKRVALRLMMALPKISRGTASIRAYRQSSNTVPSHHKVISKVGMFPCLTLYIHISHVPIWYMYIQSLSRWVGGGKGVPETSRRDSPNRIIWGCIWWMQRWRG